MGKNSKKNKELRCVNYLAFLSIVFYGGVKIYSHEGGKVEDYINEIKDQLEGRCCVCCINTDELFVKDEYKKIDEIIRTQRDDLERIRKSNYEKQIKEEELQDLLNDADLKLVKQRTKFSNLNNKFEESSKKITLMEKTINEKESECNVIKNEKTNLEKDYDVLKELSKEKNVDLELADYVDFYKSVNSNKSYEISNVWKNKDNVIEKKRIKSSDCIYIPFQFQDKVLNEQHFKFFDEENKGVDPYTCFKFKNSFKTLFCVFSMNRNYFPIIIDKKNLKEILFLYYCFKNTKDYNAFNGKNVTDFIKKDQKIKDNNFCFELEDNGDFFRTNKKVTISVDVDDVHEGTFRQKDFYDFFQPDYPKFLDFIPIKTFLDFIKKDNEENLEKTEKFKGNNVFLLELDLRDPDCIFLLENVGKGNYGVVKKGLLRKADGFEEKCLKFVCVNDNDANAKISSINDEIVAGEILKHMGIANVAYVDNYIKLDNFVSHPKNFTANNLVQDIKTSVKEVCDNKNEKFNKDQIVNKLSDSLTPFLRDNFAVKRPGLNLLGDIYKYESFSNNAFNVERQCKEQKDDCLFALLMDFVDGKDLFLNSDEIILDLLGDFLFAILNAGYQYKVAFNDLKPKNIIEKNNTFTLIDVQSLSKVSNDLGNNKGTPEYWPFFKSLNFNFKDKDDIIELEKDKLRDLYYDSIDSNFVDTYAACMTMYFTKFKTLSAAGLLTILLKWILLENDQNNILLDDLKNNLHNIYTLEKKIEFLSKYNENYTNYRKFKANNGLPVENITKNFFENIDDKNLNKNQKKKLAEYLSFFIENNENIFIPDQISNKIEKTNVPLNKEDKDKIVEFFKNRITMDFNNFKRLENEKCKYADIIKYVLCFGSCLNYFSSEEKIIKDDLLESLTVKEEIKKDDKNFFNDNEQLKNTLKALKSSFAQSFIHDLFSILPYKDYCYLIKYTSDARDITFIKNVLLQNDNNAKKKIKVLFLLKTLEKNNLRFLPYDMVKIRSFIPKDYKDNKNDNIIN